MKALGIAQKTGIRKHRSKNYNNNNKNNKKMCVIGISVAMDWPDRIFIVKLHNSSLNKP